VRAQDGHVPIMTSRSPDGNALATAHPSAALERRMSGVGAAPDPAHVPTGRYPSAS